MKPIFTLLVILLMLSSTGTHAQSELEQAFSRSYTAEADSNYSEAIEVLKKVYDKESYLLNMRLGWLSYLAGDLMASSDYYIQAIALMPYAIEPKLGYVYPQSVLGNWDKVIASYKEILKIDPQHALVNYRLGLIFYNQGRYNEAFPYVERVANLYPYDYYSVILLAWIHKQMGHAREAQVLFEKALLIIPGDASALEGLGR